MVAASLSGVYRTENTSDRAMAARDAVRCAKMKDRLTREQKFLVLTTFFPVLGMGVFALIFIVRALFAEWF